MSRAVSSIRVGYPHPVKRVSGKSDIYDLQIELDVNTDIYPVEKENVS